MTINQKNTPLFHNPPRYSKKKSDALEKQKMIKYIDLISSLLLKKHFFDDTVQIPFNFQ